MSVKGNLFRAGQALALLVFFISRADAQPSWIAGWQDTAPLTTARAGAAAVEANGVLYIIGGIDGRRFLSSAEYSRIQADGALAAWRPAAPMREARGFFSAVVYNGFVYAVGGGNGPNGSNLLRSVERARILPDGRLGPWQKEKQTLNYPRRCARLVVSNGYLYAVGGFSGVLLDSMERAAILPDGRLGKWTLEANTLTMPRYVHAVAQSDSAAYLIGGHAQSQGTAQTEVEWAAFAGGAPLQWRSAPPLATGRYGLSAAAHGGYLYALGGISNLVFTDSIEKSRLGDGGEPHAWQATTALPSPLADFGVAVYKDWIYLLGGTNSAGYYNTVSYATFNETGNIGFRGEVSQANAGREPSPPQTAVTLPREGAIAEVIDTAMYTYLRVAIPDGEEWLAVARGEFAAGARIRYSEGVLMRNFHSKALRRHFPVIRFAGRVETVDAAR